MEYPYKQPQICSINSNHYPVLFPIMTFQRVWSKNNTIGATNGTGTAYPSETRELATGF